MVKSQATYLKIKGRDFLEMARGVRVFLYPGGMLAKGFTPREISDLLDGSIFQPRERFKVDQDTEVLIEQSSDYLAALINNLSDLFIKEVLVRAAYLVLVAGSTTGDKPHFMIGIDVEGDWDRVLADVEKVASQADASKTGVDFIRIGETPICKYMTTQTEAFYQRNPDFAGGAGF